MTRGSSAGMRWGGVIALALLGCPNDGAAPPTTRAQATPPSATPPTAANPPQGAAASTPSVATDAAPMGRILPEAPLPLGEILGAAPTAAEPNFGEPIAKGGTKKTCVRFVPDRVFFECAFAWQRYADRTGHFDALEVRYEDGRVASIAFEGLVGEGELDPRVALAKVGLELPGEPQLDEPAPDVRRWSWFNSAARLLVGGRQYRVEVSSVGGDWKKTKVDLILNHPLTDEQRVKVVEAKAQTDGG